MERITIELPVVKVESGSPIWSSDFAKEHYENGLFIVDDGIMRNLVFYDGCGVCNCPCPNDVIEKYIVEKTTMELDAIYHRDMEELEERLCVIEKLCADTNSEMYKQKESRVKGFKALSERFDSIEGKIVSVSTGSEGVNILDVAKSFAIIQKPELIVELNK